MQELAKQYSKELKELNANNDNSSNSLTIQKTNSAFKTINQNDFNQCNQQECKPEFKLIDLDKK